MKKKANNYNISVPVAILLQVARLIVQPIRKYKHVVTAFH